MRRSSGFVLRSSGTLLDGCRHVVLSVHATGRSWHTAQGHHAYSLRDFLRFYGASKQRRSVPGAGNATSTPHMHCLSLRTLPYRLQFRARSKKHKSRIMMVPGVREAAAMSWCTASNEIKQHETCIQIPEPQCCRTPSTQRCEPDTRLSF